MPIAFSTYDAFARRYGIEGEAFERFRLFMTAIDEEWLDHVAKKDAAQQ